MLRELQQYLQLTLTERDVQILHLVCQESLTDRAIAQRLHVSLKTAQNFRHQLASWAVYGGNTTEVIIFLNKKREADFNLS